MEKNENKIYVIFKQLAEAVYFILDSLDLKSTTIPQVLMQRCLGEDMNAGWAESYVTTSKILSCAS